jgi:hypothetical protein
MLFYVQVVVCITLLNVVECRLLKTQLNQKLLATMSYEVILGMNWELINHV